MANESKKEAFRKYLESSGVLDALTKVLVALYEENEKPPVAIEFIQRSLGGPTTAEYERLLTEKAELQSKYEELLASHQETRMQERRACMKKASNDNLDRNTVKSRNSCQIIHWKKLVHRIRTVGGIMQSITSGCNRWCKLVMMFCEYQLISGWHNILIALILWFY